MDIEAKEIILDKKKKVFEQTKDMNLRNNKIFHINLKERVWIGSIAKRFKSGRY